MKLIPVIDLLGGQVVRGVRGDRQHYRPIVSALCGSSEPVAVACALCEHCAATQLYVADLDALQGRPAQRAILRDLLQALPLVELWLDAGFATAASARELRGALGPDGARMRAVFASESLATPAALLNCFGPAGLAQPSDLLSLDRRNGQTLDAAGCWHSPALWPSRVIVMTLERVGADSGPDLDTLAAVRRQSPTAQLIGAGGVRHAADLAAAASAGAHAWLVASALHDLRLPAVAR